MQRRRLLAGLALAALGRPARAAWPDKPIRVIVPFTAGGGTDIVARMIMARLGEVLGVPMVIDNRGGAGGMIGTEALARAAPDGTAIGVVSASHAVNPSIYRSQPFDPLRSFEAVTQLCIGPGVVVVNPQLPVRSIAELIAHARANPGALSFGSAGNGTPPHLAGELFKSMARIDIQHVAYRGNAGVMLDLVNGRVALSFPTIPSALPGIRAGQLRALAVTSAGRASVLPEVPTVAEAGLPGYEASSWYGLLAPAGLPPEILARLHAATRAALATPELRDRLLAEGLEPVGDSPASFARTIAADIAKWAALVSDARVTLE